MSESKKFNFQIPDIKPFPNPNFLEIESYYI